MSMERFGDLLLMERLAAGGMAEVFRAKQMGYGGFEKTVAVKRILPHFAESEEFKTMFRMEANLSAMLQHSNIAQIFSNGENEGYLFLVMEFVDGKNLRQLLARADKLKFRIPLEICCFIAGESLKGLDYAHHFIDEKTGEPMGIIHRDVSPQNIMMSYEGSVKVVDFGIAKAASKAESGTRAGVLKGKFGYMSPEQATGSTLDMRSDVFAMGIVLWELITQRRLFTHEDELKTLERVRECKVPKPSEKNPTIPYALEKIVMRALEKEPGVRYNTCGEFYADLARYMNDRHPNFIPTDFAKFMKEFYKEEIIEDKKRREKLNLEAPAFLEKNPLVKKSGGGKDQTGAGSLDSSNEDTAVSGINNQSSIGLAPVELRNTLNQDPSAGTSSVSSVAIAEGSSARIKVNTNIAQISRAPIPPPQVQKTSAFDSFRPILILALIAGIGYFAFNHITQVSGANPPSEVALNQTNKTPSQDNSQDQDSLSNSPEQEVNRAPTSAPEDMKNMFVWVPNKFDVYGLLNLNSVPDANLVFINGQKLVDANYTPIRGPLKDLQLPPGTYQLDLKNTVFGVSKSVTAVVEKNKAVRVDAILDQR
jgi:serine/threonine protein kinase